MSQLLVGFENLRSVLNQRVIGNLIPTVSTAYEQSLAEHQKVTDAMISIFTSKIQSHQVRYKSPVAARLQPLDENGRARAVKQAGFYTVAFPLRKAGTAIGGNRESRIKMTVQEANDKLALSLDADLRWLRDQILAAMFTNTSYTFSDEMWGDLTVLPLANGDAQTYLVRAGAETGETAQHFRAQATLTDGNQPFYTLYRDITKRPENAGGKVITFVSQNLRPTVEGLAAYTIIPDEDIRVALTKDVLIGQLEGVTFPGDFFGKIEKNYLVEWDALPDNYMITMSTGGDRPLAMREHPEAELQGFQRVSDSVDHPYWESQFERHAGFGALNRVNAIVTEIAGSYAIPTGLSQPMA